MNKQRDTSHQRKDERDRSQNRRDERDRSHNRRDERGRLEWSKFDIFVIFLCVFTLLYLLSRM